MDLGPVERIGAVRPITVKRSASDVAPPFAIDGVERMDEDLYSAGAEQQDRGLEEEDTESNHEDETPAEPFPEEPQRRLNFFA
jgi:hypothetical protein